MGLFALARAGDEDALARLFRENIRLVQALCARYPRSEDAFQQGCIGLVRAIRGYDEGAGCRFSSYAVPHILGEIRRTFAPTGSWRANKLLRCVRTGRAALLQALGREPTAQELAQRTGVAAADIPLYLERLRPPLSIFDEAAILALPDPHGAERLERFFLRDILERLPAADKRLLYLRFTLSKTQKQAAARLHLTQSGLSRRERHVCLFVRGEWIGE